MKTKTPAFALSQPLQTFFASSSFTSSSPVSSQSPLANVLPTPPRSRRTKWFAVAANRTSVLSSGSSAEVSARDIVDDDKLWSTTGSRMSKIVCTLGPKTCDISSIESLAETGMDIVRLNMSHGTHEWHGNVIANVREVNAKGVYNLGILLDTKGPEVRSGDLKTPLKVQRGDEVIWTIRKDTESFAENMIDVSYDDFLSDVNIGDMLLVDGGMSSFLVTDISSTDVVSECVDGGTLTSRRHLNVRGKSASLPAITQKDWEDIDFGIRMNVDYYALSFVKHEDDVSRLIAYLRSKDSKAFVLSKIESADAVKRLFPILEASDGAMVARGDLGAEIPIEDVPVVQDEIIAINRQLQKPTIVATHMLESMITYPTPTRAEVTDISEAVRQGADATMLSGETANGSFPIKALTVMATVAESVVAQDNATSKSDLFSPLNPNSYNLTDPRFHLAYNASLLASRLNASAIVVFTRSGTYARLISATRPRCPIVALTPDSDLVRRLLLLWGIMPYQLELSDDPEETISNAISLLKDHHLVNSGDNIVISSDMLGKSMETVDTIQVRHVR